MRYIPSIFAAVVMFDAAISAPVAQNFPGGIIPYRCDLNEDGVIPHHCDLEKRQYDYDARPDSPTIPGTGRRLARRQYDYDAWPDSPTIPGTGRRALERRQYDYDARPDSPTIPGTGRRL